MSMRSAMSDIPQDRWDMAFGKKSSEEKSEKKDADTEDKEDDDGKDVLR